MRLSDIGQALDGKLQRHRERHRPSGLGLVIADHVDYLDSVAWDEVALGATLFLSRDYLRVLAAHRPKGMELRHGIVFDGARPLAIFSCQLTPVSAAQVSTRQIPRQVLARLRERILVCGNLLSWGPHGVAFAEGADHFAAWKGIAEGIYRIRRAARLDGGADVVMVKDLGAETNSAASLETFSYRAKETEPDMVIDVSPAWSSFDDYLGALSARYRKAAVKVAREVDREFEVVALADLEPHVARLHELYLAVADRAKLRLATLAPGYLSALGKSLGPARFRCTAVVDRATAKVAGFVTTLKDGDTAVGYYLGVDGGANERAPIYLRLLQAVVADAIALGCRRLSLGRTALEPKARLGAKPVPLAIWLRHRVPFANLLLRHVMGAIPHDVAPERNPFAGEDA